jgi:ribosomal protein L32
MQCLAFSDRMATRALRDDVQLMMFRCKNCWSYKLLHTLTMLGVVTRGQWDPVVT